MRKLIALVLLGGAVPVYCWGPEGHDLVARIAEAQLTPAARAKVAELLGPNVTMASIASWADSVRRQRSDTGPWHYIDIPIDKPHMDMARDCPKGDCVIAAIAAQRKVMMDPAADPVKRREALMFVIHFVGDMHQPLHCSDNKDKGGNDVRTVFNDRNSNLHSVWDGVLLGRMGTEDQLFPAMLKEAEAHKRWGKGTVEKWAEESHKQSQKVVYGKLTKEPKGTPVPIGADYEKAADPVIRTQLEKAGDRLAHLLNDSFK
jgi:hypothetical protein